MILWQVVTPKTPAYKKKVTKKLFRKNKAILTRDVQDYSIKPVVLNWFGHGTHTHTQKQANLFHKNIKYLNIK